MGKTKGNFNCPHPGCNKHFSDKQALDVHELIHKCNAALYKCTYDGCDHAQLQKHNVELHFRRHLKLQCYCRAPGCDASFADRDRRKKHEAEHAEVAIDDRIVKEDPCPIPKADMTTRIPKPPGWKAGRKSHRISNRVPFIGNVVRNDLQNHENSQGVQPPPPLQQQIGTSVPFHFNFHGSKVKSPQRLAKASRLTIDASWVTREPFPCSTDWNTAMQSPSIPAHNHRSQNLGQLQPALDPCKGHESIPNVNTPPSNQPRTNPLDETKTLSYPSGNRQYNHRVPQDQYDFGNLHKSSPGVQGEVGNNVNDPYAEMFAHLEDSRFEIFSSEHSGSEYGKASTTQYDFGTVQACDSITNMGFDDEWLEMCRASNHRLSAQQREDQPFDRQNLWESNPVSTVPINKTPHDLWDADCIRRNAAIEAEESRQLQAVLAMTPMSLGQYTLEHAQPSGYSDNEFVQGSSSMAQAETSWTATSHWLQHQQTPSSSSSRITLTDDPSSSRITHERTLFASETEYEDDRDLASTMPDIKGKGKKRAW